MGCPMSRNLPGTDSPQFTMNPDIAKEGLNDSLNKIKRSELLQLIMTKQQNGHQMRNEGVYCPLASVPLMNGGGIYSTPGSYGSKIVPMNGDTLQTSNGRTAIKKNKISKSYLHSSRLFTLCLQGENINLDNNTIKKGNNNQLVESKADTHLYQSNGLTFNLENLNQTGLLNKIGDQLPYEYMMGSIGDMSNQQLLQAIMNGRQTPMKTVSAKDILEAKFKQGGTLNINGPGLMANRISYANKSLEEQRFANDPRLPLNRRQIFSLSKSWKGICRNMDTTGVTMFVKLFSSNPKLLPLFKNIVIEGGTDNKALVSVKDSIELETHAEIVMSTMDEAITNFGDFDKFNQILTSIGYYHYGLDGFKVDYFWLAEEPFLEAVKETLGDRFTNNMENIYKITIKFILTTLVKGYYIAKENLNQ